MFRHAKYAATTKRERMMQIAYLKPRKLWNGAVYVQR